MDAAFPLHGPGKDAQFFLVGAWGVVVGVDEGAVFSWWERFAGDALCRKLLIGDTNLGLWEGNTYSFHWSCGSSVSLA